MLTKYTLVISLSMTVALCAVAGDIKASQEKQSLEHLKKIADNFLQSFLINEDKEGEYKIEIAEPDSRLRLRHCDGEIKAFWPYNPTNLRRMPVGLRCEGTVKWKVFLQTAVKQFQEIALVNRQVSAGQILNSSMITKRNIDILSVRREVVGNYEHLIGHVFNRNISPNTPLSSQMLELPLLVRRGDLVKMISTGGTISVDAEVEALGDGYSQQTIRVRNTRSGKMLSATVLDRNLVTANP